MSVQETVAVEMDCQSLTFDQIDFRDPIFDSIRKDYPDYDAWLHHASASSAIRSAFVVRSHGRTYDAIAVLKWGELPDGTSGPGLKISTFKVSHDLEAHGLADTLLSRIFQKAIELKADTLFITVLPGHSDLVRYLELRGFRRGPETLDRGEQVYVVEVGAPERFYSSLNRLAYDLLADEYRMRSDSPGRNQESPEYLAGLLTSRLEKPVRRVLELGPGSGEVLAAIGKVAAETVAVEISPRMAALAGERAPESLIVIGDIIAVDFNPDSYDGIYAGAFLHLFPQDVAARLVRKMALWTKPGGTVFVNTTVSEEPGAAIEIKPDYLHKVARFRSRWTELQFRTLLESNGLKIKSRVVTDEAERAKNWVAFLCMPAQKSGI